MAEQDDNSYTSTPTEPIPDWLAENYREKIEDPNSNLSYEKFADIHQDTAPSLAAWARGEAARNGKDVTPHRASPEPQRIRYADLSVPELKDELEKRPHIDASDAKLKADIVKLLEQDDASKAAAARVARAAATPSLAADAFTSWPPVGSRSHKIVTTATTAATVGLPNADRPAAVAGEKWSAAATVRNSNTSARSISVAVVFYNTAGSTLGTALATTSDTKSLAAGETRAFEVNGAVAPSGTASVDVQVSRNAGSGAATSDAVHFDAVTLTRTTTRIAYRDPASTPLATWSSTPHASTQVYFDPTTSLTPLSDASPCPRMQVLVDDIPPGVTFITLSRSAQNRTSRVRGAIQTPVSAGFQTLDVECGFSVPSTYRAEMFDADKISVGFTVAATATLVSKDCWIHNPLDPSTSTIIGVDDTSGRSLSRPTEAQKYRPEARPVAFFVSSRRGGLEGVELFFSTDDEAVAARFESMVGDYTTPTVRVLCLRTPPFIDVPRTFYAAVLDPKLHTVNVHMGGSLREWTASVDEAMPPAPGIIMPILSRDDLDAAFATRAAMDAAYASRTARDRDYSKAGLA